MFISVKAYVSYIYSYQSHSLDSDYYFKKTVHSVRDLYFLKTLEQGDLETWLPFTC